MMDERNIYQQAADQADQRIERMGLVAENKRLREAQQWQPIETAPELIDVLISWEFLDSLAIAWQNSAKGWHGNTPATFYNHSPTHWMPLPEPPTTCKTKENT